jgi:hypothetical protein
MGLSMSYKVKYTYPLDKSPLKETKTYTQQQTFMSVHSNFFTIDKSWKPPSKRKDKQVSVYS